MLFYLYSYVVSISLLFFGKKQNIIFLSQIRMIPISSKLWIKVLMRGRRRQNLFHLSDKGKGDCYLLQKRETEHPVFSQDLV